MKKQVWLAVTGICLAGQSFLAQALSPVQDKSYTDAMAVVARTKIVHATYAIYSRNWIRKPDAAVTIEWASEMNAGNLHRVETPRDRLVANCDRLSGTWQSAVNGKTFSAPEVAKAACGISTATPFLSARMLGHFTSRFGFIDRIEVIDQNNVRTYDVDRSGIIIASTIAARSDPKTLLLRMDTIALERSLPAKDCFSAQSLNASLVPARFKAQGSH